MKIWLDELEGKIRGRLPKRATAAESRRLRTIAGGVLRLSDQSWSWPLSVVNCQRLREMYGDRLVVDPGLMSWAGHRLAENRRSSRIAAAIRSRPYQAVGVRRIAQDPVLAVLDEPALGKTIMSLAGLMEAGVWNGRHLVICPKTAIISTWAHEINRWTDGRAYALVGTAGDRREVLGSFLSDVEGPRLLIINPESLRTKLQKWCPKCERWVKAYPRLDPNKHAGMPGHKEIWRAYEQTVPDLFQVQWTSIIADEADRYLLKVRPNAWGKIPQWAEGLKLLHAGRKIVMTGTPMHGSELNLFGILHWLDPKTHSSYWRYVETFFEWEEDEFGVRQIKGLMEERRPQFYAMLDRYALRRTRDEVQPDLPRHINVVHLVEMNEAHRRQYEAFENNGFVSLVGGDTIRAAGVLAEITRLKQMAFGLMAPADMSYLSSPKLEFLVGQLESRGINADTPNGLKKIIVASQFTTALDWIAEQLGYPVLKITGAVTGPARDEAVRLFRSPNGPRVLLLSTMTASSITLDDHCDEMFIIDETWQEDPMTQLRGRIDNRTRLASRVFHYLRTRDTIDERLAAENLEEAMVQGHLLDGRRGVEFVSKLLGRG